MEKRDKLLQKLKTAEAPYLPNFETEVGSRRSTPSVPGEGLSLATATAIRSENVRKVVAILTESFMKHDLAVPFSSAFGPRWSPLSPEPLSGIDLASRIAW